MIKFKSTEDVNKLVNQLIMAYIWEGHPGNSHGYGYTIQVEPEGADRQLDIPGTAAD